MRRSSTKRAKPVAVNDFVTEAIWNCVSVVTFKAGFDIAKAIGPDERHLAVLHHRNSEARNLPLVHRFRGETFELGNEGRNGFAARNGLGCHRKDSQLAS